MADALLPGSSSRSSGPGAASARQAPTHMAQAVLHALVLFTCVGGIAGNSLVVRLLGSRWRRGTVGIYIPHLAAADLLFLLCSAPLIIPNASSWAAGVHHLRCLAGRSAKHLAHTAGLSLPGPAVDTIFHSFAPASFTPVVALSSMALCLQAQRSSRPRQRRPTRLYVAILGAFVLRICALPLGISGFLLCWLDLPQKTKTLFSHSARLSLSVSSSQPVIYFLEGGRGRPSLREPLGAALCRALQEEPEPEEGQTLSTGTNDEGGSERLPAPPRGCPPLHSPASRLPARRPPSPDPSVQASLHRQTGPGGESGMQ
ncbi:LOW QUALITY PROTEIN: mas-related G-protein coupled receptor member D-like [Megaptera novaeangliae]